MSGRFVELDRDTCFLLPPSVQDWLPTDHLARFVAEIVEGLDLRAFVAAYAGRGSSAYHPAMMIGLLFYGYATGVYSSRKLERSTYDSVAFRYLAANEHPDHDTIANFRKRFLKEISGLFVEIVSVAHEMGVLKLGKVSLDGTKIHANASKHKALSWEYACKIEAQLKAEVQELLRQAEEADAEDLPDGMSVPEELQRREARLAGIAEAKAKLEARAAERYAREKAEYDEKMVKREAKEKSSGKKTHGRKPEPPSQGPLPRDQVNLTDEESRIMPIPGGGFEQCYNAQAAVDVKTMLIVEQHVSQNTNDKREVSAALENLAEVSQVIGTPEAILADTGYFSSDNVEMCIKRGIEPYIAVGRNAHYPPLSERMSEVAPLAEDAEPVDRMRHRLHSSRGREIYALRKSTIEPTFGIIKSVLGFRQFLLRGITNVSHEWTLVSLGWNLKRMHTLRGALQAAT